MNEIVAGLLLVIGVASGLRSLRRLRAGLRRARSLDVVRGIRNGVVAVVAIVLATGVLMEESGLLVLAIVFLGEELYETGVLAAIIRAGERADRDDQTRFGLAHHPRLSWEKGVDGPADS